MKEVFKKNPLISVIMPVYNGDKYVGAAIDSILNQTFVDFEFIIINDGSTDSSKEIILSYNDERIIYIENIENLRLIKTLNKGLKLAKGKYVARMDADDISHPMRFEKQVIVLESNSRIGLCGTNYKTFGKYNKLNIKPKTNQAINNFFIVESPFGHPTVMLRKSLIIDFSLSYDEDYLHAEDYKLWLEILKRSEVYNIQEFLLEYRTFDEQISNRYNKEQAFKSKKIRQEYLSYVLEKNKVSVNIGQIDIEFIKNIRRNRDLHADLINSITLVSFLSLNKYSINTLIYFLRSGVYFNPPYSLKEFLRVILKHFNSNYFDSRL